MNESRTLYSCADSVILLVVLPGIVVEFGQDSVGVRKENWTIGIDGAC